MRPSVPTMSTRWSSSARVEQVKKFRVLDRNFTVDDGELTPTLKVKRAKVNDHFADDIEAMYAEQSAQARA